jgi:N-acetylglucosamine-6-sulfatase
VVRDKPAWKEVFELRKRPGSRALLDPLHVGDQEEIRQRAAMIASVDEGVGALLRALDETRQLERTCIVFLGDNGYFFGEHGLGAERRFAYEEGIRTAFFVRYPQRIAAGTRVKQMATALDIAPTMIELGGGKPGEHIQGLSLVPLFKKRNPSWRKSFLIEYYNEAAWPWIVGMTYKAVRTDRHKLIHWVHKQGMDELYDLAKDPYEMKNLAGSRSIAAVRTRLQRELRRLVAEASGL